ncbi:hypothetical protein [Olleya marilimosa]|uniref:Uncharacterized protein n=1 Tax=Olleya marilimosa TaxID=272164 RepID=A0ABR8LW51_9FLAO|nr:hypothetical protein [Olleya marilimosa]MBD3862463.1 hypothetical protein [Olleya marilimosa]
MFLSFAIRPMYYVGYVAYFQLNIDYIIDTYCVNKEKPQLACNGKCHLAKQLQSPINDDNDSKAITNIAESFFPVFYTEYQYTIDASLLLFIKQKNATVYNQRYAYNFDYFHFKPPIV